MKTAWKRRGRCLCPASEQADEWLLGLSEGQEVMGDLRRVGPRNVKQFRLWWILMRLAKDHGVFPTDEAASYATKIAIGHFDLVTFPDTGEIQFKERSIAWNNLPEEQFIPIFKAAVECFCNRWVPGTNDKELEQSVYEIVDGPQRSSLGRRA